MKNLFNRIPLKNNKTVLFMVLGLAGFLLLINSSIIRSIPPTFWPLFALWSVIWMGLALWYSARKNERLWFLVFLLIHTLGILDIIYLAMETTFFSDVSKKLKNLRK